MIGEGVALARPAAGKSRHRRGLGPRQLGGEFVCRGGGLRLFEGELKLIDKQPGRAFRVRPAQFALQLLDGQLLMGDEGGIVGRLGLGNGELGGEPQPAGRLIVGSGERRRQRGAQRVELVRQGGDIHDL